MLNDQALNFGKKRSRVRWLLAAIGVGVVWRLAAWGMNLPVRAEEAFLLNNVLHRGPWELLEPLANAQVCPPGVLWLLDWMSGWTSAAWVLRVPMLAAGLMSVALFWPIARWVVPAGWREARGRTGKVGAVGECGENRGVEGGGASGLSWRGLSTAGLMGMAIFSVSYVPVSMSVRTKQYAFELLAGMVITVLVLALVTGRDRQRDGGPGRESAWLLVGLIVACPLLFWVSYNSLFMGAAAGLVLTVWAARGGRSTPIWMWAGLMSLAAVSAVSVFYLYELAMKPTMEASASAAYLNEYWAKAFMPLDRPWLIPWWVVEIHSGRMYAYPLGDKNFASVAWFILWIIGVVTLWRNGRRWPLAVLVAPQLLMMLASGFQLYPYGLDPRVNLALAPAICLLMGVGATTVGGWFAAKRLDVVRGAAIFLVVMGCVGVALHALEGYAPWRRPHPRDVFRKLARTVEPGETVVSLEPNAPLQRESKTKQIFEFYAHATPDLPIHWDGRIPPDALTPGGTIYLLQYADRDQIDQLEPRRTDWLTRIERERGIVLRPVDTWQSVVSNEMKGMVRVDRYRVAGGRGHKTAGA
jgi:hypothetical protein